MFLNAPAWIDSIVSSVKEWYTAIQESLCVDYKVAEWLSPDSLKRINFSLCIAQSFITVVALNESYTMRFGWRISEH